MGFKTSRFYWSFRQINKKCRYMCRIDDMEGAPEFVIKVVEEGYKDLVLRDKTAKGNVHLFTGRGRCKGVPARREASQPRGGGPRWWGVLTQRGRGPSPEGCSGLEGGGVPARRHCVWARAPPLHRVSVSLVLRVVNFGRKAKRRHISLKGASVPVTSFSVVNVPSTAQVPRHRISQSVSNELQLV